MKTFFFLVATFISATVFAQGQSESKLSIDIGITSHDSTTSVDEILSALGYSDVAGWEVSETLETTHISANFHVNQWTFGVARQSELLYEVDIRRSENPYIDRVGTAYSWWSARAERSFVFKENIRPFVSAGVTHSKINGFLRLTGETGRTSLYETEPFVRVGIAHHIKKVQLRVDFTKRFTDSDFTNLSRISMRVPLGT